jgi:hypothetical protein
MPPGGRWDRMKLTSAATQGGLLALRDRGAGARCLPLAGNRTPGAGRQIVCSLAGEIDRACRRVRIRWGGAIQNAKELHGNMVAVSRDARP